MLTSFRMLLKTFYSNIPTSVQPPWLLQVVKKRGRKCYRHLGTLFGLAVRYRNLAGKRQKIERKVTFMLFVLHNTPDTVQFITAMMESAISYVTFVTFATLARWYIEECTMNLGSKSIHYILNTFLDVFNLPNTIKMYKSVPRNIRCLNPQGNTVL
jgi:hypothetical protein